MRLYQSTDSVSPVSCQSKDFDDVLNVADDSVLLKCNSVIADLQFELEEERRRRKYLEAQLEEARKEVRLVFAEMETVAQQSQEYISEITRLKMERLEVEKDLQNRVSGLECKLKKSIAPNIEYEEFKAKALVKTADTSILVRLRDQLSASSAALRQRDIETQRIANSYELQIKMLKDELKSNQVVMDACIRERQYIQRDDHPIKSIKPLFEKPVNVYTPSITPPTVSSTQAEWEQFKRGFSRVQYN